MSYGPSSQPSQTENPLEKIQGAIDSLNYLASRLVKLSEIVDRDHTLPQTSQKVKLAGVVLHSRDADKDTFLHSSARSARATVLDTAEVVEKELHELADLYTTSIAKQMEEATHICQATPCGGASWELDMESLLTNNMSAAPTQGGNQKVDLEGMNTPCGRLQMASMKFLETTYTTKPQVVMGSRAHLLLKLAIEFNLPLQEIRNSGTKEQNQKIRNTFETQLVPTPWLRSDEEYQHLLQIQQEMEKE
jgi:hypothetical protein